MKRQIKSDPRYKRVRENGQEFGRAGKAGKVLRRAFIQAIATNYGKATARMMKVMMNCLKADTTNNRGERDVVTGDLRLVEGYNLNERTNINSILHVPYYPSVDRATGAVRISIASFSPDVALGFPEGTTHFRFTVAAVTVDFVTEQFTTVAANSSYQTIDSNPTSVVTLSVSVLANSTLPIFVLFGIRFYGEVDGTLDPINSGTADAVTVVKVEV